MSLVLRELPVRDDTVVGNKKRCTTVKQSTLDKKLYGRHVTYVSNMCGWLGARGRDLESG